MAGYGGIKRNGIYDERVGCIMKDIILVGGGGHCKSVIDSIVSNNDFRVTAILDNKDSLGKKICGYSIEFTDDDLQMLYDKGIRYAFITVGSTGKFELRRKLYEKVKQIGFILPVICDPSAVVSTFSDIGEGVFIGKKCVVNTDATVGNMSIINTGTIIEHECKIGEHSFIAIGANIAGNASIGHDTYIGAGTTVIQGITVAEYCMIGAGSVVVRNVNPHTKAYGVPCREVAQW